MRNMIKRGIIRLFGRSISAITIFRLPATAMAVVVAAPGCWRCCEGMLLVAPQIVLSRSDFLLHASAGTFLLPSLRPAPRLPSSSTSSSASAMSTIPLQFLPVAGCLAVSIAFYLEKNRGGGASLYRYSAVVDTASPFLTAPPAALDFTRDASRMFPTTQEQYGETVGQVQWRRSRGPLRLESPRQQEGFLVANRNLVLGVTPENLLQETGGLFCGLMAQDDNRPSLLEQLGCQAFILDYATPQLTLVQRVSSSSLSRLEIKCDDEDDSSFFEGATMMDMYDLGPYGPNLHHYCVPCSGITLLTRDGTKETIPLSSLNRDVVIVIDSGLTGCVMTDSWKEESLPVSSIVDDIQGMELQLGGSGDDAAASVRLLSDPNYWTLACFRLPWFTSESDHPHIIAAGATFLVGCSKLVVDTQQQCLGVEPRTATAFSED